MTKFTHPGQSAITPDEERAITARRFAALMAAAAAGQDTPGYDTVEMVHGANNSASLPTRTEPVMAAVLALADAYVAPRRTEALLVWHRGALIHARYFDGVTAETPINAKSLAKPLGTIAVARAIQLGSIASLDTPVAHYVTQWADDPLRARILVRHLLDMRSGFRRQDFSASADDVMNRAYLSPRHDEVIIDEYPLTSEPGTQFDYSNATSEMIAPLIERATELRYGAFLSREVLVPLGMAGGPIWVNRPGGTAHSGCCIGLPAQSWLRLALVVLERGGTVLDPAFIREMTTGTAENPRYGLGVWLEGDYLPIRSFVASQRSGDPPAPAPGGANFSEPLVDKDVVLFDGNGNQVAFIVPSRDLIILRLGQTPPRELGWDNSYLPNLIARAAEGTIR